MKSRPRPQPHARPHAGHAALPGRRRPGLPRPLALALAAACLFAAPPGYGAGPALALPSGLQVVQGQATLAASGNRLTVSNSANALLNWQQFSIGAGNAVHFAQPSAASKVLNRVVGSDPPVRGSTWRGWWPPPCTSATPTGRPAG